MKRKILLERRLLEILCKIVSCNRLPDVLISLGISTFLIFPVAVDLVLKAMIDPHLTKSWVYWVFWAILSLFFGIILFMTYKFEANEYLVKLAFRTIKDHSLLIYLFREVIQKKLKEDREYLYRSGFLLKYIYEAFEMMRKKLNLIDIKSLIYLTGIDYREIARRVDEANEEILKARQDPGLTHKLLENKENVIKDELKSSLKNYLNDDNYKLFLEANITDRDVHIYKLSRVIINCTLQSSYTKAVKFVAETIHKQLFQHLAELRAKN